MYAAMVRTQTDHRPSGHETAAKARAEKADEAEGFRTRVKRCHPRAADRSGIRPTIRATASNARMFRKASDIGGRVADLAQRGLDNRAGRQHRVLLHGHRAQVLA